MESSQLQVRKIVLNSFLAVRAGFAAEYVLCDPALNLSFIANCRKRDATSSVAALNTCLLNLRKRGDLSEFPTIHRKAKSSPSVHTAVQNAIRFLERQLATTVDHILCDPTMRDQFDALLHILAPECSLLDARYAALTLRKKNALKPEIVGRIIETTGGSIRPILDIKVAEISEDLGVYLFFDRETTLYAGKADNLRRRIDEHLSTWTARELLAQIRLGKRSQVFLVIHTLKSDIAMRSLFAYETELIRSRDPSHNRAGKLAK